MEGKLEQLKASGLALGIGVSIPVRPVGLFKKRRRSITMHHPGMGGMMRIARKYLEIGVTMEQMNQFTFEQQMEFIATHGKAVSELVAYAVVRGCVLGRWLNRPVAWWLRWRVHPVFLAGTMIQLIQLLDTSPFGTIIKSAEVMNVMTRRLSHKANGS